MNRVLILLFFLPLGCHYERSTEANPATPSTDAPYLVVLGITQDAGYPQAGCYKPHCLRAWNDPSLRRGATSLALIDPLLKKKWLFEATPDIKDQLYRLEQYAPDSIYELAGVFLTHGHMGHYTGLMHLGREAMNAKDIKVHAMPRMREFLNSNGPWDQLVKLQNIILEPISDSTLVSLSPRIEIIPFEVPHRDEYTETVGYQIVTDRKKVIFIPDIDKWGRWSQDIVEVIRKNDFAFLDATFFDQTELPGRDMSKIPHPFVIESIELFSQLADPQRSKIYFIHFNHSNSLLDTGSEQYKSVINAGYKVSDEGLVIKL
ncbi:MAG: MBL fold metallo-hydrolase [Bacteroidota bacterium]